MKFESFGGGKQEKDPLRQEYDRVISECKNKRFMLQQAATLARTADELKFAVRLGAVRSEGVSGLEQGEYITSNVDDHVVPVERVFAAIDQYAQTKSWSGFGGDIPPYVHERLIQIFGEDESKSFPSDSIE